MDSHLQNITPQLVSHLFIFLVGCQNALDSSLKIGNDRVYEVLTTTLLLRQKFTNHISIASKKGKLDVENNNTL